MNRIAAQGVSEAAESRDSRYNAVKIVKNNEYLLVKDQNGTLEGLSELRL